MEEIVVGDPNLIANVGIELGNILSKYIFDNVVDFDLSSLYPSIILAFNIDPTTQIGLIDILEFFFIFISEIDTLGYDWDTVIDFYYGEYDEKNLTRNDLELLESIRQNMLERTDDVKLFQSKLVDDILTNDFIDNAHNYFGLPNITEALTELCI